MSNYQQSIILFLKKMLLLLIIYQLTRALFFYFNNDLFTKFTFQTFLGGLRFDLSAIVYLNSIFIIGLLIPGNFKYNTTYQTILKRSFYIVNLIFIATNFIDIVYYRFTGRRSSFAMITAKGMENETLGLIPSFLKQFWYIALFFLVLSILFWKLIPKLKENIIPEHLSKKVYFKQSIYFIISLLTIVIIGRGGLQKKPIKIVDAIKYGAHDNTTGLVLNTPFTIITTLLKKDDIDKTNYFSAKKLTSIYNPKISLKPNQPATKKNVIILILESFGNENVGRGQTPFLDSLITRSYYFKNAFANGRLSIDAVPSIFSSLPSLMNNSFLSSSYSLNKTTSLAKILKKQGYKTSFFHGAFNGSQNFDRYTQAAGFDQYFGKDQYVGENAFDGKWGVFDEEFLQFFAHKLSTFKKPFFSSLFTISSHNPYTIPEKYQGKFPKGTTQIQESIAYTDYSLRKFFNTVKKEEWYKNTLFVISSDHTSGGDKDIDKTNIGKYRIPILFFDPSNPELISVNEKNFQQIDIMPSVLDYLNIKTDMICFGKSYKSKDNYVINYLEGTYHFIQDDYYLAFTNNQSIGLYNWKKDVLLKKNLIHVDKPTTKKAERFLKAYIQSFNERVIANQLAI